MQYQMQDAVAVLSRTPATLDAMLRGLPDCWLQASEGPGTFTPVDVLGHLIYAELADWIPRAQILLEHGESKPFEPFDRHGGDPLVRDRTVPELLDQFAELRAANL